MNAITRPPTARAQVTQTAPMPNLPAPVARYLQALEHHAAESARWKVASTEERESLFVGPAPRLGPLTAAESAEAGASMEAWERALTPVTLDDLMNWLGPVNGAFRNAQGKEDFSIRIQGIHRMVSDLPVGAFTDEAFRRLPAFFPAGADVRAAVEPGAMRLRAEYAALAQALRPPPSPRSTDIWEPTSPTPEQRAESLVLSAATKAVLRGQGEEARPSVKPAYLSGEALRRARDNRLVRAAKAQQEAQAKAEALRKAEYDPLEGVG